jgi:hypothetical protein
MKSCEGVEKESNDRGRCLERGRECHFAEAVSGLPWNIKCEIENFDLDFARRRLYFCPRVKLGDAAAIVGQGRDM